MIKALFDKQKTLIIAGAISFTLFIILAIVALFDSTEIMGVNRWIKPMKFTLSPAIYLWTLAIYLYFINGRERARKLLAYGVIAMMAGEIALIILQAARGTTSHFNVQTGAFNAAVFSAMGMMILINTILIIYLLNLYFRAEIGLPKSVVWGMRFGIILFVLAGLEGFVMSSLLRHSIGVADGGAGLTFVNWSTKGGDLRAAHFIGMHAFQVVPFFAYTMESYKVKSSVALTFVFAALYCAFFTFVFVQAMSGRPLLAF